MCLGPGVAKLAGMDRSLNGDDLRLLATLNDPRRSFAPAPALDSLPGWFRRVVAEQCQELGIQVPGEAAASTRTETPAKAA